MLATAPPPMLPSVTALTRVLVRRNKVAMADPATSSTPAARDHLDALLESCGRGDRRAFGEVYDEVGSLVYGIALRVVRDPARAEEISQEAFLEVWRKATRYDRSRGSAKAWICTIAHRRAVDVVRSEQSRRDREAGVAMRESRVDHDSPEMVVEASMERSRVVEALAGLTDLQRQAIELAYYDGHTYREVADLLGAPLGTVKTRMRDGLARLASTLGGNHG